MDWMIQAAQLILSLSILVVLHEAGHFIPARLFKTRVEKFYLFFDPWFSLFKYKKGDTEYGVGWLPLGGYVKISGMIDESMDKEQLEKPAEPWEFRAKPAWQRLIIMLGGVTVNAILGIAIYIMIAFVWGGQFIPNDELKNGIYCDSLALSMGLENGDQIISVDNRKIEKFSDIRLDLIINQPSSIQVLRDGKTIEVPVPPDFIASVVETNNVQFISPALIAVIEEIAPGSQADEAGLTVGDRIVKLNNDTTPYYQDAVKYLKSHPDTAVQIGILREGQMRTLEGTISEEGTLGFYIDGSQLPYEVEEYNAITAIPAGFNKGIDAFSSYLKQMKLIFNPSTGAYKGLGGFIAIGNAFSPEWNWERFWTFTAFLSIILAIMNLLPIPALDGGHVMFLTYEIITGRKPHDKVLEYAQVIGMILLFSLLIFANANDVIKLFR